MSATLRKEERIYGKKDISTLMEHGHWCGSKHLRACVLNPGGSDFPRMMVSVPKREFKRAVKRNLLKRRIREAFRLQKELLEGAPVDILWVYSSSEILDFKDLYPEVGEILKRIKTRLK